MSEALEKNHNHVEMPTPYDAVQTKSVLEFYSGDVMELLEEGNSRDVQEAWGAVEDEVLEKMMIQDVNIKDKEKLEVQEAKALVKEKCKAAMVKKPSAMDLKKQQVLERRQRVQLSQR
jgi:hypothetical protein